MPSSEKQRYFETPVDNPRTMPQNGGAIVPPRHITFPSTRGASPCTPDIVTNEFNERLARSLVRSRSFVRS